MILKEGVSVRNVSPQILLALNVTDRVFQDFGTTLTVTSLYRPPASKVSKHATGDAFDARIHHLPATRANVLADVLRESLGPDFDVVVEDLGHPNAHIHVEYDPKPAA